MITLLVTYFFPFPTKTIELFWFSKKTIFESGKVIGVTLLIKENSYVSYEENKKLISGFMTKFEDNTFKVWDFFSKEIFTINKTPYKEENLWKIKINWKELSRKISKQELEIPEELELKKMVNNFFIVFKNSVYKNDYKFFYDNISERRKSKTSQKELESLIAPTIRYKLPIEEIIEKDIAYNKPPYLDENNLLVLDWYYKSAPLVSFRLHFVYEYPQWKIAWYDFFYWEN